MKHRVDANILVNKWPTISCTLMKIRYCEVVSELDRSAYPCVCEQQVNL